MRDGRAVFDGFHVESGGLERGDGTFPTAAGAFDSHIDFLDTEFSGLFGTLLSGTLASKRGAFATAFESASTCTGPAKGFAFGVGDGNGCVIEGGVNVSHTERDVFSDSAFFSF